MRNVYAGLCVLLSVLIFGGLVLALVGCICLLVWGLHNAPVITAGIMLALMMWVIAVDMRTDKPSKW